MPWMTDNNDVTIGVGPNLDAFGRLRTSTPSHVFDVQFTHGIHPVLFEQIKTAGGAIEHDATNRLASISLSASDAGEYSIIQQYGVNGYQSGRSQLAVLTFNFQGGPVGATKFVGYSDGTNGVELRLVDGEYQIALLSGTDNGDQVVAQQQWNMDRMDGKGPSRVRLDSEKEVILVIAMQALYVGSVTVLFNIRGQYFPAHQFDHSNYVADPSIQTANLPVRAGIISTGAVDTAMRFNCCSVVSEGGQENVGGYSFTHSGTLTVAASRTLCTVLRPRATFNGLTNRARIVPTSIELAVSGNYPVRWELCIGQALAATPVFSPVNSTYSAVEYNADGTLSGDPAIVVESGWCPASSQTKGAVSRNVSAKYPITLDAAGGHRDLGSLALLLTAVGGNSTVQFAVNWEEIQ